MREKNNTNLEQMRELIERLTEADIAYYKNDAPIMTDLEYDRLTEELAALEHDTGLVLSGSPTQKVSGENLESLAEVRHTKPMLSAGKTKSIEELIRFAAGRAVLLSWKMDGLTLVLRYEYGKLKQAITRGREGIIGEDVTHTVRTFRNVPLSIPTKESFEVRGEGVISWESFHRINARLEEPYTHPRNLASGSTRKLDAGEASKRRLEFWAFAYPVDGLVMEYEDLRYGKSLGATGHHENRLIALKWADELYSTRFRGVELATTRTGMVSITGLFDPISIDGTLVSRAYLHNLDIFDEFQFGIGDEISVYKANMIIPQIADNKTQSNTYMLPTTCPCCGKPLTVKYTSGGTRQLYCGNPHCAAKLVQKFAHFCEKTRMNIEGLSATTLEKLIGHGWVRNFGDLYELEQHREDIVRTEGFGERSFDRLQAAIEKSRRCTLAKFIAGLGIPMVGRHAGRDLDRYFHGSWAEFEAAILNGFDFTQLPDFGETMHNNIYTWYADAQEAKLWRPLLRKIQFETKENLTMETTMNNPFAGKTVVATGKLEHYTRDGIQEKLISLGAHPSGAVSKKTDYLIVGEKAGSKLTKAQQLGVKTLTEQEFEDMLA